MRGTRVACRSATCARPRSTSPVASASRAAVHRVTGWRRRTAHTRCLWASQTGNAEDFAAPAGPTARRLAAGATWTTCRVATLAAAARRSDRHQHVRRRRAAGQRRRLLGSPRRGPTRPRWTACVTPCWASATGPMTTSAAMPSRSTAGSPTSARPSCSTARVRGLRRRADGAVGRRVVAAGRAGRAAGADRDRDADRRRSRSPAPTRSRAAVPQHVLTAARRRQRRCGSSASTSPSTTSATRSATRSACAPSTAPTSSTRGWPPPAWRGEETVEVDGVGSRACATR